MTPVQVRARIVERQVVGEYVELALQAPDVAVRFQPGQFVAVAVGGEQTAMVLRRAFALYDAGSDGSIRFVVAEHGAGTRWLVQQQVGDLLDVVGPLGTPFPLRPGPAVLVGGGYGTAPLVPLARRLATAGAPVQFVLGAGSAARLFGVAAAEAVGPVTVTTDDGSAGRLGVVTDVLEPAVARIDARTVYACGPMAMLRAVGDVAAALRLPAYVAVEEAMACGIGVCMTCVLPVVGSDGASRFVRACVDGPVFRADRVRWADVGQVPGDLVGAAAMKDH